MTNDTRPAGGIAHFDVFGPDAGALGRFYAGLFGWEIDEKGPGYALVRTPDGTPDGAIVEAERGALTVGVAVDDIEAAVATAATAGGEVVVPPTDNGWVVKAQIRDPAGNLLTLIQR